MKEKVHGSPEARAHIETARRSVLHAKTEERISLAEGMAADRKVLGPADICSPALGEVRDARHPRWSARAGFAGRTEPLAGT